MEATTLIFGLAPGGVCTARPVTKPAVRSYRTISPLLPKQRYLFCCTFPRLSPAGCYPAPCLLGARTFLSHSSDDTTPHRDYTNIKTESEASVTDARALSITQFNPVDPRDRKLDNPLNSISEGISSTRTSVTRTMHRYVNNTISKIM